MQTSQFWIDRLDLQKHPEGGYYNETFRSDIRIAVEHADGSKNRAAGTIIYYLLEGDDRSRFHKLQSDEVWFHHAGSPLIIYSIEHDGQLQKQLIGNNPGEGQSLQLSISADTWFAAELLEQDSYSLLSCAVFPGFEFSDFQLASRNSLIKHYPQHAEIIRHFTDED
jgi:uncharacterized protein